MTSRSSPGASAADPLDRFVQAQAPVWREVEAQLRAGRKTTHWMWFVFPQLAALGRSETARFYGLRDLPQAEAYLRHPVLGPRLLQCCEWLLGLEGGDAQAIFGGIDAMKLRSCLTLFALAAPQEAVFRACLARYFGGEPDRLTESLVGRGVSAGE